MNEPLKTNALFVLYNINLVRKTSISKFGSASTLTLLASYLALIAFRVLW